MRLCWFCGVVLALLSYGLTIDRACAQKRVALVIGNGDYASLAPIKTASKDADDVSDLLNKVGFEVTKGTNLSKSATSRLVSGFYEEAKDADLALFYFTGHAFQAGGSNFLMPTDVLKELRTDAMNASISLEDFLRKMPGKPATVIFLDAARDDPFRKPGESSPTGDGFLSHPRRLHITFATAPGAPRTPNEGENSAFATALLKHMRPGIELRSLMNQIRAETATLTKGRQTPWSTDTGIEDIYFSPVAR